MKVLSKGADKFIGFHVDKDMETFLTLLSIIREDSKSSLLREIVKECLKSDDNRHLHYKVAQRLLAVFEEWKDTTNPKVLVKFIKSVEVDLLKKKIPLGDIEMILKEFNALIV